MIIPPIRGRDCKGSGYFGASRGRRKHAGVDFVHCPGEPVCAFSAGTVTKLGFPYAHHLQYRYVQVTDADGIECRYFYVEPCVALGDTVRAGQAIGATQKLGEVYPGITEHFHFEIRRDGEHLDPLPYLGEL